MLFRSVSSGCADGFLDVKWCGSSARVERDLPLIPGDFTGLRRSGEVTLLLLRLLLLLLLVSGSEERRGGRECGIWWVWEVKTKMLKVDADVGVRRATT